MTGPIAVAVATAAAAAAATAATADLSLLFRMIDLDGLLWRRLLGAPPNGTLVTLFFSLFLISRAGEKRTERFS